MSDLVKALNTAMKREKKDKIVTYRMTAENKKLLQRYAKNKGMTLNDVFTSALLEYFEKRDKELQKN